jgi:hypothetical protein
MLIDPQLLASGSGNQDAGHGDIPPLTGAFPTSPGYGQAFAGRDTEAKENALGREEVGTEAEQSVCAGCSMLPNSLGGDSYLETISWIKCDGCKRWFHYACAGFTEKEVRSVDKFSCTACWEKCGPTTCQLLNPYNPLRSLGTRLLLTVLSSCPEIIPRTHLD